MNNVSVIIPCLNEEDFIVDAVNSVLEQEYDGEIELIVVDGMSTDRTVELVNAMAAKDPRVQLIENPQQFAPAAMNLGIKQAKYDFVLRLDAHAKALPGFIKNTMLAVNKSEEIGCAGGIILNQYQNKLSECIGAAMSSKFGVGNATFRVGGEESYVDTVAFGVFRKSVLQEVDGYDESLARNEDDDLSYRIIQAGYKILYDPKIKSEYYVRSSISKLYNQYFQYGYWKVKVGKKHKAITTIRQLIPLFFVLGLFVGGILSAIIPKFWMLYTMGLALYVALALLFATHAVKDQQDAIKVAGIFPVLHFSYGFGYLKGILDFLILNKEPAQNTKKLTR